MRNRRRLLIAIVLSVEVAVQSDLHSSVCESFLLFSHSNHEAEGLWGFAVCGHHPTIDLPSVPFFPLRVVYINMLSIVLLRAVRSEFVQINRREIAACCVLRRIPGTRYVQYIYIILYYIIYRVLHVVRGALAASLRREL